MFRKTLLVPALFLALGTSLPTLPAFAESSTQAVSSAQHSSVNINTATADELANKLKGIGPSKAQAIVDYRTKVGKFVAIDQLAEVKGIGKSTVDKNRAILRLK